MQKTGLILIALLFLSSCGLPIGRDLVVKNKGEVRQFETSNPLFSSIVSDFEQAGKQYSGNANFSAGHVPVNFGNTENDAFEGVCFSYPDGTTEVIIKESWWNSASQSLKESLLFHELGHCVLGRDHDNETHEANSRTYKASLMNSVIVNPGHYNSHKGGYLTELFTLNKSPLFQSLDSN